MKRKATEITIELKDKSKKELQHKGSAVGTSRDKTDVLPGMIASKNTKKNIEASSGGDNKFRNSVTETVAGKVNSGTNTHGVGSSEKAEKNTGKRSPLHVVLEHIFK